MIQYLLDRRPDRKLAAVGTSLGGNVLLKYLGEAGSKSGLRTAAAGSVPFDLKAGSRHMESGFARVYVRRLLRKLQTKLRARAAELADRVDVERALQATTFWQFDDAATAPLHGFDGAADYYERSSSAQFIEGIKTRTLVLHSKDDPFLPAFAIPSRALAANPAITPVISEVGGHVGMIGGSLFKPYFWAENTIADWISERF